jgi:hypothetical protein
MKEKILRCFKEFGPALTASELRSILAPNGWEKGEYAGAVLPALKALVYEEELMRGALGGHRYCLTGRQWQEGSKLRPPAKFQEPASVVL